MEAKMIKTFVKLFICISFVVLFSSVDTMSQEKTLIIGAGSEPLDLLPSSQSQPTMDRVYNVYEPLVWLDEDAKAVPRLATKWEAIDGNKKWRFYLRKNVVFHDGTPFTAEDVAFTLDFTNNPQNKLGRRGKIKGYAYKIIDDYTIDVFREDGKTVDPVLPPTWCPVHILSKETVTKMAPGEFPRNPIGTGPFQFVEWKQGEQITLKAFDKYWGGKPKIDKIIYKSIPEMATRVVALKTGDVDIIPDVPPEEIKGLEADPNVRVVKKSSLYVMQLSLRCDVPPFKDNINLRKAVAHAIDVEAICKNIFGGNAIPVGSVNPPAAYGFNANLKPYKYDPALAKDYLGKSGYKGEEIAIQSSTGRYLKDIEFNTAVEAYLKAIGMNVKLRMYDWPTWINLENTRKVDPIRQLGWAARTGDGAENIFNTTHSVSPYSWYGEKGIPGVDEALDTAGTNFDQKVRKEMIEKAQELLYNYYGNALCYVPIKVYGIRKNVKWVPRADETMCVTPQDDK